MNIAVSSRVEADVALLVAEILGYLGRDGHGGGLPIDLVHFSIFVYCFQEENRRKTADDSRKKYLKKLGVKILGVENTTIPEDISGRGLENLEARDIIEVW